MHLKHCLRSALARASKLLCWHWQCHPLGICQSAYCAAVTDTHSVSLAEDGRKGGKWFCSHARMVVRECCKDDQQSQWEMLKFDPQLPLNPLSDRHQIWHA